MQPLAHHPADRDADTGAWPGIAGIALLTLAIALPTGPLGLLSGALLAAVWARAPPAYAIATGTVLFLAIAPTAPGFLPIALVGGGTAALALAPAAHPQATDRVAIATGLAFVGLLGIAWVTYDATAALWLAGTVLAIAAAVPAYVMHRYERARLARPEAGS